MAKIAYFFESRFRSDRVLRGRSPKVFFRSSAAFLAIFPPQAPFVGKNTLSLHQALCAVLSKNGPQGDQGLTGFDSRQSLMVSTPSVVWALVKLNARITNGNNSYALAA